VSLSYSYLARVYRLNNPDAEAPPSEAQIEEVFKKQKEQVITQIAKLVIPPKPEQVSVVWHHDTLAPEPTVTGSTLDTSLDLVQRYGPASGLGVLALIALGMMMRLAKQRDGGESFGMEIGLPRDAIEAAKQAAQDLRSAAPRPGGGGMGGLTAAGSGIGSAEDGAKAIPLPVGQGIEGVLDAQEVPQWEEQIHQMLAQVSQMTDRDAQAVATLVENWVEHAR
jgi:hypothetical protein